MRLITLLFVLLFSTNLFAGDEQKVKQGLVERFTSGLSDAVENILDGEGDTQVRIDMGEDYKPEFSIVTVRPIAIHHSVDATFIQLQLSDHKIRGDSRLAGNIGVGYRKLSDSKTSMTGANVFFDYDEKGNARASVGVELRSSAFDVLANYYVAISGGKTVGDYTERTLDGYDISVVGQVPYIPWVNVIGKSYRWEAEKNSKDSTGETLSFEMTLTPNLIAEVGFDDNNINGTDNFAKITFIYPPRETPTAATEFVSKRAFVQFDMSTELLSIVRRSNKQSIESEGTGVVITRLVE